MRRFASVLVVLLASALLASASSRVRISPVNGLKMAQEETIEMHLNFLCDTVCAGRATGTKGSVMAGIYIAKAFEEASLLRMDGVYFRDVPCADGTVGHNIVGMLPSTRGDGTVQVGGQVGGGVTAQGRGGQVGGGSGDKGGEGRYIIVAAHYDHFGVMGGRLYPGADSNASGTVAMMTLASMMRYVRGLGKEISDNIIFVALDGKEKNMAGAKALWEDIKNGAMTNPLTGKPIKAKDIRLFVDIDQLGSTLAPLHKGQDDYLIMLSEDGSAYRNSLKIADTKAMTKMDLGFSYYGSRDFTRLFFRRVSENRPFLENGIHTLVFTSGITTNNNKTSDTVESLDIPVLKKRIVLIYHLLFSIV